MESKLKIIIALLFALLLGTITCQNVTAQATDTETEEGVNVEKVMSDVRAFMRDRDWEGAIDVVEKALKEEPKNAELLMTAAGIYNTYGIEMASDDRKAANKPLRRAAELMRELQKNEEELTDRQKDLLSTTVYNEACCAAIDEDADAAFKLLREAVELGFTDPNQIENDTDFESIRDDDRFDKILEELDAMEDEDKASRRPSDDV